MPNALLLFFLAYSNIVPVGTIHFGFPETFNALINIASNSDNGILLNVPKSKTVNFQNSFYVRAPSVWNILRDILRDTTRSIASFKSLLFRYYFNLLEHVYNPDNPRTFKSVCVKCHSTRCASNATPLYHPIQNLSFRSCC